MRVLENITYEELQINDYATFTKTLSDENLVLFAATRGNLPVASLNVEAAKKVVFDEKIGYGMWASSLISTAFDKVIPGPGSIYLEQSLKFNMKVNLGDTLTVKLTVDEKIEDHRVIFSCEVKNQDGDTVIEGSSKVIAPTEKLSIDQASLPKVTVE